MLHFYSHFTIPFWSAVCAEYNDWKFIQQFMLENNVLGNFLRIDSPWMTNENSSFDFLNLTTVIGIIIQQAESKCLKRFKQSYAKIKAEKWIARDSCVFDSISNVQIRCINPWHNYNSFTFGMFYALCAVSSFQLDVIFYRSLLFIFDIRFGLSPSRMAVAK